MAAKDHCSVSRCCHIGQSHFGQTPFEKESQRKGEKRRRREKGEEKGEAKEKKIARGKGKEGRAGQYAQAGPPREKI